MIDKFAGLPTQIRQLEKRLKEMDASKVKPALVKEITDTIKNLKDMLKEKQEKREQRKKDKEEKAQEVEAAPVASAPALGATAPNAVTPTQPGQPEATPTTPDNVKVSCPLCGGVTFPDQAAYQQHMEFTHASNVMPTSPTQKLDKTVASVETEASNKCVICNIDFANWAEYDAHRKEKHGPNSVKSDQEAEAQFKLDDVVMPARGSESKGKVMRWDGKPNDLVYVMWESGPLKERDGFGGYYPHDLKADVPVAEPVEAAMPEKPVCQQCVSMQEKHGDLKTNYEALLKDLKDERDIHYTQGNSAWVARLDQKITDLETAIAEKFGTEKHADGGLSEHEEHTQVSPDIEGLDDLFDILENRLGWSIAEQFRGIMEGEALEEQNDNALRYIAEFLEKRKDKNPGAVDTAKEIRDYLAKPLPPGVVDLPLSQNQPGDLLGLPKEKTSSFPSYHGECPVCKRDSDIQDQGNGTSKCSYCGTVTPNADLQKTPGNPDYKSKGLPLSTESAASEPCPKCGHGVDDHNEEGYCDPCVAKCSKPVKKEALGGPELIRQITRATSGHGYEATVYDLTNGRFQQHVPLKINETNVRMKQPENGTFELKYSGMPEWRPVLQPEFEQWLAEWKEINQKNNQKEGSADWNQDITEAYQRGLADAKAGKPSNEAKEKLPASYRQGYGHGLKSDKEAGAQNAEELTIMDHTPPRANSGPDAGGKDTADEFQDEWAMPLTSATKINVFKRELLATPAKEGYDISHEGKKLFNIKGKENKPMNKKQLEFCAQIELTRGMKQAKLVEKIASLEAGSTVFVMAQDKTTKRVKFASLEHGFRGWAPASKFAFLVKEGEMRKHKDHIDNTFGHNGKEILVDCPNGSGNMVWLPMGELLPINPPPATPESLNEDLGAESAAKVVDDKVEMPKGEFIKEHEKLVKELEPMVEEHKEQGEELEDVKKASLNFPLEYFTRPEAKERADQFGLIDVEDHDLTPAGLAAKKQEMIEGHDIEAGKKCKGCGKNIESTETGPYCKACKAEGNDKEAANECPDCHGTFEGAEGEKCPTCGRFAVHKEGLRQALPPQILNRRNEVNAGDKVPCAHCGQEADPRNMQTDSQGNKFCHSGCYTSSKLWPGWTPRTTASKKVASDDKLLKEFQAKYPDYNGWMFDFEYPGYYVFYDENFGGGVYFTPDFNTNGMVDVQVIDSEGEMIDGEEFPYKAPLTADALFAIVKPYLDKGFKKHADLSEEDDENGTGIEPGDLVDFGAYGQLYVVSLAGRSSRVTDMAEERFNPNAPGWYYNISGNEPIIEKGSDVSEADEDSDINGNRTCKQCGAEYTPQSGKNQYCSKDCWKASGARIVSSLRKVARVVHHKDGWHVLSEKGKNLGGPYKSKSEAVKRLRQVEYFKHNGAVRPFGRKVIAEVLVDPYQSLTEHITDMRSRMTQVQDKIQNIPAVKTAGEDNSKLDLPGLFADLTQGIELLETKLGGDTKADPAIHKQIEELENKLWKLEESCGITPKLSAEEKAEPEHKEVVEDIKKDASKLKRHANQESVEDYLWYLQNTLIPDMKKSGNVETAKDFQTIVRLLKSGKQDPGLVDWLLKTLIPDLVDSGRNFTAEDLLEGIFWMTGKQHPMPESENYDAQGFAKHYPGVAEDASLKKADTPVDPNAPVPQVQNVQPTDDDNLEVPVVAPTSPPPPGQKWVFDTQFNKYVLMPDPAAANRTI